MMAGTRTTVSPEEVRAIAGKLEQDNQKLKDLLEESKKTIEGTRNYYTGDSGEATREAYNGFAAKYFQSYYEVIEQYTKFLRNQVAQQYEQVENANKQLAQSFQ